MFYNGHRLLTLFGSLTIFTLILSYYTAEAIQLRWARTATVVQSQYGSIPPHTLERKPTYTAVVSEVPLPTLCGNVLQVSPKSAIAATVVLGLYVRFSSLTFFLMLSVLVVVCRT